ncbi:NERD domain-containing protein [Bacillus sp. HMF5848]|uniref:nuclease-related domain-containing protein n=1 Tax=Bacillus sp. HMF5848 TaxID=2495421 RepID=UPI000F7826A0|nr:nuclease-related domain-containing protein [Bacillus sp. HMF5848]RSK26442.1 NERD domain-containing protein [Bacillus sp. HMF5848]
MIVKKRDLPIKLMKNEAVFRRLPEWHPKKSLIQTDIRNRRSGLKGEREVDYFLSLLPNDFRIYQDLRLRCNGHKFQMDFVIDSGKGLYIVDAKNNAGQIIFGSDFNECIQVYDEKRKILSNPLMQVLRQQSQLEKLLKELHIDIPIKSYVVFTNPHVKLTKEPGCSYDLSAVFTVDQIHFHLLEKDQEYSKVFSNNSRDRMKDFFLANHTPETYNPLDFYEIDSRDLLSGIQCPTCHSFEVVRRHTCMCKVCGNRSRFAYKKGINDFFLLYGRQFTNKQLSEFLGIDRSWVTQYLVSRTDINGTGNTKARIYHSPYPPNF